MQRRQLLAAASGIALGSTALAVTSRDSKAMNVEIDGLNVADTNREVNNPVAAVQLGVDGTYQFDANVQPTRVVFRLEARPLNGSWSQLDAIALRNNLSKEQSDTYSLSGDLLEHHEISPGALNPQDPGESKTLQVEVRVKFSVSAKTGKLGEEVVRDSASITVSKSGGRVDLSLSASGSVGVTTET